jgi:hypothetical protein
MSIELGERFWSKVRADGELPGACMLWTSALDWGGYPMYWLDERRRGARAHRVAFKAVIGPIPVGLTLDHLCRVRHCVNPGHLEPCTAGENAARSPLAPYNVKKAQTHCKRGHAFTPANTRRRRGGRSRCCRTCDRAAAAAAGGPLAGA